MAQKTSRDIIMDAEGKIREAIAHADAVPEEVRELLKIGESIFQNAQDELINNQVPLEERIAKVDALERAMDSTIAELRENFGILPGVEEVLSAMRQFEQTYDQQAVRMNQGKAIPRSSLGM